MEHLKRPLLRRSIEEQLETGNFFSKMMIGAGSEKRSIDRKKTEISPEEALLNKTYEEVISYILKRAETTISTPFSITCLEFSESTGTILFGSSNGNISSYDLEDCKIVDDVPLNIGAFSSLKIDESKNILVTAGENPSIRIFKLPKFDLEKELIGHSEQVNCIELDKNNEVIYSVSDDSTVRKWDIKLSNDSQILVRHTAPGRSVALCPNLKYVFSGGDDCIIRVYDLILQEEILNLKSHSKSVTSLSVNSESSLLASGGSDSLVIVWNIHDFTPIHVFNEHKEEITCLRFTLGVNILISGSKDFSMRVWDLDKDRREIVLNSHTANVNNILLTPKNKHIVSCSKDKSLKVWTFPEFLEEFNFKVLQNDFISLIDTKDVIVSCGTDKRVRFWNRFKDEAGVICTTNGAAMQVCVSFDEKWLAVGDEYGYIYTFHNKEDYEKVKEIQGHKGAIRALVFIKSGELASGGGDSKLFIWNIRTWEKKQLMGHQQSIWCIGYSYFENTEFLVSGSSDKTIRVWNINELNEKLMFQVGEQASALCVTLDGRYVISGGVHGTMTIWSISEKVEDSIFNLHTDMITGFYITKDNSKVISVSKDATIQIISLVYRVPLTYLTRKQPIFSIAVSSSSDSIITGEHQLIYLQSNPLTTKSVNVIGPHDNLQKFLTYIKNIVTGHPVPHDLSMDKFIIVPYFFNSLHLFSVLGLNEYLASSFTENAVLFPSSDGFHPLYIGLLKDLTSIRDDSVDALIKIGKTNPFIFQVLENVMIRMNKKSFSKLGELYEAVYQPVPRRSLPKFCLPHINLPLVFISNHTRVLPDDFFRPEELVNHGIGILFKESYVKIGYVMGSKESLEFLESLAGCGNLNVLRSSLIQDIIRYKWETAKFSIRIQGGIFYVYLFLLSVYISMLNGIDPSLNVLMNLVLFFYNSYFTVAETFQMAVSERKFYFTNVWNYVDWSRALLLYLYFLFDWFELQNEIKMSIFIIVIFLSCLRGVSYFRLFKTTRYLVGLLFEVAKDITGFLILLTYSTISFCFLFMVLIECTGTPQEIIECQENKIFSSQILSSYDLVLGNMGITPMSLIQYFCLTLALLINPIIMLNLLISIIGDTFAKIMADSLSADMKELLHMIREVENLMFFRRGQNQKQFFQECASFERSDSEVTWEGQIRAMQAMMEKIESKNLVYHENLYKQLVVQDRLIEIQGENIEAILKALEKKKVS